MIVGGFDDISEEGSYEFANMKATSNFAETEFAMGREPTEMSQPATTTRAGVSFEFHLVTIHDTKTVSSSWKLKALRAHYVFSTYLIGKLCFLSPRNVYMSGSGANLW